MPVELDTVFDECVSLNQLAENTRLLCPKRLPEPAIRIAAVADKADAFDFDHGAFGDLEHEIHPVLIACDDLGGHSGSQTTGLKVGIRDRTGIGRRRAGAVHPARLRGQERFECFIVQPSVAFDADAVDRRIFRHVDDQHAARRGHLHRFEQPGAEQALLRGVDLPCGDRRARIDTCIGQDGVGFYPLVAAHLDLIESGLRQRRASRDHRHQHDEQHTPHLGRQFCRRRDPRP